MTDILELLEELDAMEEKASGILGSRLWDTWYHRLAEAYPRLASELRRLTAENARLSAECGRLREALGTIAECELEKAEPCRKYLVHIVGCARRALAGGEEASR